MTNHKAVSLSHWGAFEADIQDGRLVAARPWEDHGANAQMIGALPELIYSSRRIDRPHIRASFLAEGFRAGGEARGTDSFVPVAWDTALDCIAFEIDRVRNDYGHTALFAGSYGWSSAGRFHHARSQVRRFFGALGGFTDQVSNYSWGAAQIILEEVLGSADAVSGAATAWDAIVGETDTFVAFGGLNPKNWHVTSGGAGHHPMPAHVERAAKAGTRFVIISPFADDGPPGIEAEWLAPRPGSDTAIMIALTYEMVKRGRADRAFLNRYTSGFERYLKYLEGAEDGVEKSLQWASAICDLPLEALQRLADQITTGKVMLTAAWSLQRAQYGEMTYWALIALAAVLGQIGEQGGGFGFGYGSLNAVGHGAAKGLIPSLPKLPNIHGTAIPVARVADMLEEPGRKIPFRGATVTLPDAKLFYWAGGNPFHHAQHLFRLEELWKRPQTIIVNEQFWTPTALRADIVLPATTSFERNDIGGSSRDRHVFFMPRLIDPVGEARDDYAIFSGLAKRLGVKRTFTEDRDEQTWLRHLWQQTESAACKQGLKAPDLEALKTMGVWKVPTPEHPEVLLEAYRQDPQAQPLPTPSGRIELFSKRIESYALPDFPPHPAWLEPDEWLGKAQQGCAQEGRSQEEALALLSRQPKHFLHSQLAQTSLAQEPSILLHERDAKDRGLVDGQQVCVRSAQGACLARLTTTRQCRRGVAAMETGPWFIGSAPLDDAMRLGHTKRRCDEGGNPNALTHDRPTSSLAQATAAQTCLVWVEDVETVAPSQDEEEPKEAAPLSL
ncbi:MAG: molybdopterin-dependent oxidoreductase [Pseudomonadota bacterium]